MRSANPTLTPQALQRGAVPFAQPGAAQRTFGGQVGAEPTATEPAQPTQPMTAEGTAYKTLLLLAIATVVAGWSYGQAQEGNIFIPVAGGMFVILLGVGLVTAFKPRWAIVTGPLYAVISGVFLGAISALYAAQYDGIVGQAILGTLGTALGMLVAYQTGLIKVTSTFRKVVVSATLGIMLLYAATIVMNLFGAQMPLLHDTGPIGIGISLFIVGIAALNLVLDFDFIAQASQSRQLDKRMEWYGAFGLLVTLVWLYLEMLRLLAKLRD